MRTHGISAYRAGCRCGTCRIAAAAATRRWDEARIERAKADPTLIPHGTLTGYNRWHCRCGDCCEANSVYQEAYRARRRERAAG